MWIELHDSTRDHPKIIKLARDLGIPRVQALGHMCSLWLWVLRMAPDGDLGSFDSEDIEIAVEWEGEQGKFAEVANARGLIDIEQHGMVIHDWPDYATHLKAAERKRKERARKRESQDVTGRSRDVTGQGRNSGHVTLTDRPTEPTRPDRPDRRNVNMVWKHWLTKKPTTRRVSLRVDHPEYKLISKRLKDYSVEDLCNAINGMFLDDWAIEHNTKITWALREDQDNMNVQDFIDLATGQRPGKKRPESNHELGKRLAAEMEQERREGRGGLFS